MFTKTYQLTEKSNTSDLVLVRSFNMHEYEINDNLLAVARAGAGVNNIPLEKMADEGVVVFNTPGANANGVKELVIAGMLLASRDIYGGISWVKNNKSDENILKSIEKAKKAFAGSEIMGKTLVVIGLGAIGGKVANAADALGMKVYGYDPYISEHALKALNPTIEIENDLNKLYEVADFISLHLPLLDSTKHMFNKDVFKKVKDGVVILNYARDQLVKNEDIKEALENKKVSKYVTDFPNHYVANLENVIALPHLGASTHESEENCAIMAAKQLMQYVENGDIINSVNYPNVTLGNPNGVSRIIILAKDNDDLTMNIDHALKSVEKVIVTSVSKSRKGYSVFAYDLKVDVSQELIKTLSEIPGVTKVRKI
ncbi:3-phosphoglycerate dehydrogenase [Candidatus Izemoplasma sp. B36]|uniref:3-phosphoglycerate dehydrogenase n=1 Tax=Candidatus Izemoplasma sp. B36 TaxID=3242468 RepID=UPI003555DAFB